jgi:hypothetical protein
VIGISKSSITFLVELQPRGTNKSTSNDYFTIRSVGIPGTTIIAAKPPARDALFGKDSLQSHMILILYFNYRIRKEEISVLQPLGSNGAYRSIALTPDRIEFIRKHVQDGIVYGTMDNVAYYKGVWDMFDSSISNFVLPMTTTGNGNLLLNRCGSLQKFSPGSWKYGTRTPMGPNSCIDSNPFLLQGPSTELSYPFKFHGSGLQHHAQQIVVNTLYFFKQAEVHPHLLQGTPIELTGRVVNIYPNTVTAIVEK